MSKFEARTTDTQEIDPSAPISNHPDIDRSSQVGFSAEELVPRKTYVEAGIEKLTALCGAVGLADKTSQAIEIFRAMTASWGDRQVGDISGWESKVSDDGAPFEFSIAFTAERAELRVLVEAQGAEPNLQSNWAAGLQLNQYLADNYHVSLDRFRQVEDLYVPHNPDAKFAIWHSACFYPDKEPEFKLYLNPQSRRSSLAAAVVEESLVRLGFTHAWPTLADTAAQRGPEQDEFVYFSLDLSTHARARVKVYIRHHDATVDDLEKALSAATNYVSGDATEFCRMMAPAQTTFAAKPVICAFSWVEGDDTNSSQNTLHLPISKYAADDLVTKHKIDLYLNRNEIPSAIYHSAIQVYATRKLEEGSGMHSYTSLRRERGTHRITIYLNPEVNRVRSSGTKLIANSKITTISICELMQQYRNNLFEDHPFFQRLHREPMNLTKMWLLFANFQEGIVDHFTRRLSLVVAHIDNEYIRCILAHQLNEELGNGDPNKIHRKIFDRLKSALDKYKPLTINVKMLAPAYELSQCLEDIYNNPNPYIGVGAAIMMELAGEQRDRIVTKELVRTMFDEDVKSWFLLHGEIEADHVQEVMELAQQIDNSDGDKAAVLQGLDITSKALLKFCNGMYQALHVDSSAGYSAKKL